MPNLAESLQGRDLGHLMIISVLWGLELEGQDSRGILNQLVSTLLVSSQVENMVANLTSGEKEVMVDLIRHSGRLPWAQFTRVYGEVREMGVARRDREQPHKQPVSVAEALWYRALFARAFFDTSTGPEEFAYIPDDLLEKIPLTNNERFPRMGRQAAAAEYSQVYQANDHILDHTCTLLAAMRMGISIPGPLSMQAGEELYPAILKSILTSAGFLDRKGLPQPDLVRTFLEVSRPEALVQLVQSWRKSIQFNELRLLPDLSTEGNWENDPLNSRQIVLGFLTGIPVGTWWSLGSFLAGIKLHHPDFQRPAGDYDSWFVRDTQTGDYLRGFENWDAVDGRLIMYILTGPLFWLGALDLGCPEGSKQVTAFRLSRWSRALLKGNPPIGMPEEDESIVVRSDARVSVKRLVPRRVRYQLARFCEWGKETPDEYQYQISSVSLSKAKKQGLNVSQLLTLLNRSTKAVPPSLIKALERWENVGSEARLEKMVILRVASIEVLQSLRNSRASRFLGEPLGPSTIAIKAGASQKVLWILAELGYLGEIRDQVEDS